MKTGIVSNVYDSTATTAYTYGASFDNAYSSPPATGYLWTDDDQGIGNAAAHSFAGNLWDVTPGTRTISEIKLTGYGFAAGNITAIYVEVWRSDASDYTLVASAEATLSGGGASGAYATVTPNAPLAVTTEAGKTYYAGVRVLRTTATAAAPGWYATTGLTFAYNNMRFAVDVATWNGTTVSKSDSANHLYTYNSNATGLLQRITYTTDRLIEQDRSTLEAKSYWIAKSTSTPYVVKMEGVVVADGQALTAYRYDIDGTGANAARLTLTELDCGNSTPGQNDMIYSGSTVNLPDITQNSISYGQEGGTFDLWWGIRMASAGREDLYWQDRTLEMAIHAHAVAAAGARGTLKSSSVKASILTLSGTFTASKLRVGTKPIVIMGDSQAITGYYNTTRTPNTDNWGGMPTALTKERIWFVGGQAGGYVATVGSQPGLKLGLIKSATPGVADGVEMSGTYTLGCTWFFAGMGVNDAIGTTSLISDAQARMRAADLVSLVAAALEEVAQYGDEIILAGLPPTSKSGTADQYDGKAVRWFNRGLLGLALSLKCAFYNPWPDMVTPGTEDDSLPTFLETYTSDSGTHYSTAGGSFVRSKLKIAMENATVDLRDAWD